MTIGGFWLSWYNLGMSDGGFLEGFEPTSSSSNEPATPAIPAPEPMQAEPAPVFGTEPAYVAPVDLGYSTEPGEALTPGQADRLAIEEMDVGHFLEEGQEQEPVAMERAAETAGIAVAAGAKAKGTKAEPAHIEAIKDEVYEEVEKIVEDGLGPFVETMEAGAKDRFLKKGRDVTAIIAGMVRGMHIKTKEVFRLLKEWLLTIPGVNKFFLEQEVKIKTDRIVELDRVRREDVGPKL